MGVFFHFVYFFLVVLVALQEKLVSGLEVFANPLQNLSPLLFGFEIDHVFGQASSSEFQLNLKSLNFLRLGQMISLNKFLFDLFITFHLLSTHFQYVQGWDLNIRS